MRTLVTGGGGFLGSHLVERLFGEGGWRVTVVDDFNDFYDPAVKRANVRAHLGREDFRLAEGEIQKDNNASGAAELVLKTLSDKTPAPIPQGDYDVVVLVAGIKPVFTRLPVPPPAPPPP